MSILGSDNQNSATANNSIVFNPSIILGDDNATDSRADQTQRTDNKQSNTTDTAASVGLGFGGSGSGGTASMAKPGSVQASQETAPISGGIASMMQNTTVMIIAGVIGIGGILFMVLGRRKKK